jgi:hypothetical protein
VNRDTGGELRIGARAYALAAAGETHHLMRERLLFQGDPGQLSAVDGIRLMSTTTLLVAHQRFAAALDDLRRRYVAEFDQWLKAPLAGNLDAAQAEAAGRIAAARKEFADEFLDQRAPAIIRSFNPDAEHDILKALRTYEAKPEPRAPRARSVTAGPPWQAGLWRTVVAAAFGAVVGVMLLSLQPIGDAASNAAQPLISITRETMVLWLLGAAFAAAVGAAVGVFAIACPPLHVLLERTGLSGAPLRWARKLGAVFVIFRGGPLIALVAVLLCIFFALIFWLLGGTRPLHILIGITALMTILTARWTVPENSSPDQNTIRRNLLAQLDDDLRSDSKVWAALSAALVLRRDDGGARISADAKEITNIILSRRAQKEPAEDILLIIEQQLGLPGARAAGGQPKASVSEFVWRPEDAHVYTTFGVVEVGDRVTVSSVPLYVEDASGAKRVSQKGVVTRKR